MTKQRKSLIPEEEVLIRKEHLTFNRDTLLKHIGHLSQVAGLKRYRLVGGKADGVEAVDVKTGSGFSFTVLPGRGMDIAWAEYKGIGLSYIAKPGVVGSAFYEPAGIGWLRGFFAGLLTTCGLSNVGWPCKDKQAVLGETDYGLHGRISFTPAENVCVHDAWEPDYTMRVSGRMREAILHGEHLVLERELETRFGRNGLTIRDTIENAGFIPEPFMILYHFNLGYPLLDHDARLILPARKTTAITKAAQKDKIPYGTFAPPSIEYDERLFFHDLQAKKDGSTAVALMNDRLNIGVAIRYNLKELPKLSQWKCLRNAEYVLGLEPGNCHPTSRAEHRRQGTLEMLEPGERRKITVDIDVLAGREEMAAFEQHSIQRGDIK
jgi:hypothetical protein